MVELPGGTFRMGSDRFYPEERPVREAAVGGFWIDRHPVTVAQFRRFVKATSHVTWAQRAPEAADYPGTGPADLVPGSLVLRTTRGADCPAPAPPPRSTAAAAPRRQPRGDGAR